MADHQEIDQCNGQNKRYGLGKRTREIKPLTSKTTRQVTFSKRRRGIFKKASELCALCDAEVAIITFSSAGKVFSFGHPSVDDIIHRFLNFSNAESVQQGNGNDNDHNCNIKKVISNFDLEKKRVAEVGLSSSNGSCPRGNNKFGYWWDMPIDDNMGLNELEQSKVALEGLRMKVSSRIDGINRSSSMSVLPQTSEFDSIDEWEFCC